MNRVTATAAGATTPVSEAVSDHGPAVHPGRCGFDTPVRVEPIRGFLFRSEGF